MPKSLSAMRDRKRTVRTASTRRCRSPDTASDGTATFMPGSADPPRSTSRSMALNWSWYCARSRRSSRPACSKKRRPCATTAGCSNPDRRRAAAARLPTESGSEFVRAWRGARAMEMLVDAIAQRGDPRPGNSAPNAGPCSDYEAAHDAVAVVATVSGAWMLCPRSPFGMSPTMAVSATPNADRGARRTSHEPSPSIGATTSAPDHSES